MRQTNDHFLAPLMVAGAGFLVFNDPLLNLATQSRPINQIITMRS